MIGLMGKEGTKEYAAASELRNLIISAWPEVATEVAHKIKIISSAKCYGQKRKDIDVIIFAQLAREYPVPIADPNEEQFFIKSFCLTIEVKSHTLDNDGVRFRGNEVFVRYKEGFENASDQSEEQQTSLRDYLSEHNIRPPYIINLIWLRHVPQTDLPKSLHNIIGAGATWDTFLQRIGELQQSYLHRTGKKTIQAIGRDQINDLWRSADIFTKDLKPSSLDRKKMDEICKRVLKEQHYKEKIGQQLLIYRGRGGTGKTIQLLKVAHDLFEERDARVLILTYNKALVSDIKRVLALLNISDGFSEPSIAIRTIHLFLFDFFQRLGILPPHCSDFVTKFDQYKAEALKLIGAVQPEDIEPWDYIFIDESQDWPTDERDILFSIYDYRKFVLADGIDQLIRSHKGIDWRENLNRKDTQVIPLKRSLRLKSGLCTFTQTFAKHLGFDKWIVEHNHDAYGGHIIVLEGPYAKNRAFHDRLVSRNEQDGNSPIDMLFCVPPKLVKERNGDEKYSVVGDLFTKWGFSIWDGVNTKELESYPTKIEQFRIVQYDSSRGLEGWIVVNFDFHELYDFKLSIYKPTLEETNELFFNAEKSAVRFALRWLMIPLTRAIDTLVIQVPSHDHPVKTILRAVADECGEIVEWLTGD